MISSRLIKHLLHPNLECLSVCRQRNLLCVCKKQKKTKPHFVTIDMCMWPQLGVVRWVFTWEGRFHLGLASRRPIVAAGAANVSWTNGGHRRRAENSNFSNCEQLSVVSYLWVHKKGNLYMLCSAFCCHVPTEAVGFKYTEVSYLPILV